MNSNENTSTIAIETEALEMVIAATLRKVFAETGKAISYRENALRSAASVDLSYFGSFENASREAASAQTATAKARAQFDALGEMLFALLPAEYKPQVTEILHNVEFVLNVALRIKSDNPSYKAYVEAIDEGWYNSRAIAKNILAKPTGQVIKATCPSCNEVTRTMVVENKAPGKTDVIVEEDGENCICTRCAKKFTITESNEYVVEYRKIANQYQYMFSTVNGKKLTKAEIEGVALEFAKSNLQSWIWSDLPSAKTPKDEMEYVAAALVASVHFQRDNSNKAARHLMNSRQIRRFTSRP